MASSSYAINFNGLLTEQGEQQVFTFDGVIGDRIFFDGIDADPVFENISYSLIDPSGATIFTNFGHTADTTPATLTLSGTYQIVIRGDASTTGDYNFSLLKLNQAPILPLGATVTDALTPGIRSNVYRLNGTRGQRLQFDSLLAPPTSTTWVLYGPGNQALNSSGTSSGTDFSVTLPADGEYYLVFDGTNATASVSYSFQVNDISDPPPASPTAFPFSQSGSVSGSPVDFTFTAAAGTLLYIDSLDPDFDSVSLQILDQGNGNASIYSANASSDSSAGLILPRSGSYTVRVNGSGDYNFRILDLSANATPLTLGSTTSGPLAAAATQIFSFSGAVGQQLFYDALDSDFDSVQTYLIGPSGTTLTNLFFVNASSDSDVFTLSESGTYYLVQQSTVQTATDFSFRLLQAPATDLAFDTVTSSTLVPLGTELYRFTGTAGQRLVFDSQSPSASSASVVLRGPNGEAITSGNLASDFEITLTRTGSHILYIDSTSASSIPYSFQLVTPTTTSTSLTLGSAVSGSISEPGEQDIYTFTGTAGQRLLLDATVNNSRALFATLRSPSGALVINFADTDFDSSLVTLTETGTYQLSIEGQVGSATGTGNYNFQLIDASTAPILPLDTVTPGTLTPGAESEFYRFTAAAGQRFAFDGISGTGPTVRVFDAGNSQIGNGSLGFDFEFTTPEAGTYLLQIEGSAFATSPVSYSFSLVTPTTTSTVLSLGSVVSGSIGELGEQDIYTFAGTAGQRLLFDATVNNARVLFATLRSPSGALVINSADTDFDSGLVTLTETGIYQLIVEGLVGNANSTGSYDFQLIDAAAAPVLTLDTETAGTLTPGAKSDFYRFTAAAGQRFAFDAITGTGPNFRVFDAGNTQIFSGSINFDYEFTTPEAGTYLLQIEGNSNTATPVSYSFQLVTPTTTSTPLTLGSVVSGSITELGEQDIYTFSGTAGQRLFFDATVNNTRSILATLRSPSGTTLSFLDADSDGSLITLTEPGTYQLIVEGQVGVANSTGDYDFKLIDASNAPLITLGTAITGTLSPGRESDFYRISGTAGQRLTFDSLAAATGANWRLFDPNNVTVAGSSVGAGTDFTAFLDATGTYLLQIDGSSASDVSYNFNVTGTIDPPPAAPTAFPFSQSGTVSGSPVDFTITAAAGKLLYVDSLDPDFDSVSLQILDQGNANTAIYSANAGSDSGGGFALPRSGSYTVRINGTGDYNFRILDLSANATPLTLGAASSGPLAAAATQIFSFSGSAGQRLYFDALEEDNDSLNLVLLRPDGSSVLSSSGEADSFPTFSLSETGAYHLLLVNNATTAADFNFALRDVAAATALPFDTVTNGSLSPGQETDLFRFTGTAGQRLVFDSQTAGFPNATWRVIGPANQSVANQNISTDLELNLTADGTYVLAIDGSSTTTVNYGFSLITPSTTTTALSLNSPVSSSLSEMGERDIYTFTGTAGQRLYYDALTSDFTRSFPVRLIDPTGDIVFLNQQHYFDSSVPFTLTETGTYQLQLESTSSFSLDTGAYSFQLLDLAAATALPFDTVTNGTLSPGQDTDLYRFTGTAGQRLVFDSQTPGFPSVSWRIFGPGNQSLANQNITSDLDLTLSADGTYVLAIDGASATNVNYSFSLVTPTTSTTALSLNSPVSSSLAEIGERDIYTFTGSVGQRLYYDALTNDSSTSFPVRLIDPTGDIVFLNQQHYADSNTPFTLTEAGTYQLLVESTATFSLDSGAYSFQLLDVAAATALNFDTVTSGTLSPGQDTDLYRFTGTAGQRLVFDSLTPGFPSAAWRLFGPTNQSLVNQNLTTDLELNLTADGTYILAIDGASATSVNYSFNLITPTSARTGAPNIIVADRTGNTNTPIPLNIAASFAASDGNDQRSILISGVPSGALLSAGTNNNNGTWTLTPAQLAGLTITVANAANFALTVTATSAETTGDTATTTATFSVIVNVATGITVTPTSGLVTTEAGGSATFTVVLDSQPTANVTVGISSSDTTEGTTNLSSLTFTPANWNVPQTVIVTGVDDPAIDGTVAYSIVTAAATSSDPNYNGFNAANVSVSNTDNDTAGVTVAPTGGLFTSEGGGTSQFSVRLTSQPSANVSISIASSDSTEGSTNVSSLTFTPANWNAFQFVTVTGVDDGVVDGNIAYTILTGATTSTDANYSGLAVADVGVTNVDNDAASFSISDVSITEGNSGTTTAVFTVTLSNAVAGGTSVSYATANGTASAGTDYVATSGTLNFTGTAGEQRTVAVTINGDTAIESDEFFVLNLSAPTNGVTLADSQGVGTITNDDAAPLPVVTLAVSPGSVTENGTSNLVYTFTRTGSTTNPLTVNYSVAGTATNGTDYGLIPASITFAAGSATATVTVDPTGDAVVEADETVSLTLSANAAYTIGTAGAVTGTITNDDTAGITVSPAPDPIRPRQLTTSEGSTDPQVLAAWRFNETSGSTAFAAAGSVNGSLLGNASFTAGGLSGGAVTMSTAGNGFVDMGNNFSFGNTNSTFSLVSWVKLQSGDTNGYIVAGRHQAGAIAGYFNGINNTNSGSGEVTGGAIFYQSYPNPVSSNLSLNDGNWHQIIGVHDFNNGTASLSRLYVNGELRDTEGYTGFNSSLANFSVGGILNAAGTQMIGALTGTVDEVSIWNRALTASDARYLYANPGALAVTPSFTVVLNSQPTDNVTIGISSSDTTEGTVSTSSLVFTPANWNIPQTVTVTGVDDAIVDRDEGGVANGVGVSYSIVTAPATSGDPNYNGLNAADVSVINNDNDTASLSINDVTIIEGNSGTTTAVFTVTLSNAVAGGVSVNYATANGTATAGSDYVNSVGTLNFTGTAGETKTVSVTINGDTTVESDETFFVNLSGITKAGVTIADGQGLGTITTDDVSLPVITLAVSPASVAENGAANLVYTFTRTGATTNPLTVIYTVGGSASSDSDYAPIAASVTILAGSATATVTVDPTADAVLEPDETIAISLAANAAYVIGTPGAVTGTISNDDTASFSVSDVSIVEGNAGTSTAVFTVTLSNAVSGGASVSYATANGTATAGVDYVAANGTLNFTGNAGEQRTVSVTVTGDTAVEFDESFFLNLSAPTNGVTIADGQGRATVTNDDVPPQPAGIPVLFFSAVTAAGGRELWLTDGTAASTRQVIDAAPGATGAFPSTVQLANGKLLFASDDATGDTELWVTDGTTAGTSQLVEINPIVSFSSAIAPTLITPFDGGALFFADDGTSGNELWFTDGTAAGTRLLADIQPGPTGSRAATNPARQLTVSGGKVFFTANTTAEGNELWVIESVSAGPRLVTEIVPGSASSAISVLTSFNDGVFFYANDGVNGVEAWYSDGTAGGTLSLGNLSPLATARTTNPTVVGDRVFFAIETSNTPGVLGAELWVSNGTVANTTRLLSNVSWPINTVGAVNGKAVFIANDGVNGSELWVSDGTPSGTRLLKDIQPGGVNSNGALAAGPGALFNGELYFRGTTTAEGAELWKTDGTEAGTVLVADINPGTGGSNVSLLFSGVLNGRLYFQASTPGEGLELWSTDGTAAGTSRVADINPGTASSTPTNFSVQVLPPPVVSISLAPAAAEEGEAFILTATRSGAVLSQPTTVTYTITGPAATAGDISTPLTGTITILSNQTTATLSIATVEDTVVEADEPFTVTITNPINGSIGTATATATILNDDAAALSVITLAVSPASVLENGATNLVYTFTRTGATTTPLTVNYAINGTATGGTDYAAIPASVTFAVGSATATVTVDPTGDTVLEPNETVSLTLQSNAAYIVGTAGAVIGTITNDDDASFSISDVSITEGNSGTTTAVFTVTLSNAVAGGASVNFATADGTATAGSDYLAASGTLNFAGTTGETQTISVTINGDTAFEPNESFFLNLSAPTNGVTLLDGQGIGTITNDDAAPLPVVTLALSPASVTENGTTNLIYTFTRTGATTNPLTVNYAINGTATNGSDYGLIPASIVFAAGSATATVTVDPTGDSDVEPDETVSLTLLANAAYAISNTGAVTGTITNDDVGNRAPVFVADPAKTIRPGQTATFTGASLVANDTDPDGNPLSVSQFFTATSQGGSVANTAFDTFTYTPAAGFTGTDIFSYVVSDGAGGFTNATLAINVVNGAPVFVADPAITIRPGQTATINGATLLGNDTDPNGDPLSISQFFANTSQGGSVTNTAFNTFTYTPFAGFTGTDTFAYVISDGFGGFTNATLAINVVNGAPVFVADPAITIQPGQTATILGANLIANDTDPDGDPLSVSQFFTATSQGGTVANTAFDTFTYTPAAGFTGTDTFFYVISDGFGGTTNATLAINVQAKPSVSVAVSPASVLENGASNLVYTFTRTGPTTNPLVVNYSIGGSATNGTDYGLIGTSITFATGSATATLSVDPTGDSIVEPDETVVLTLLANDAYTLGTAGAVTGTITNDDLGRTITGTKNRDSLVGTAGDDVITGLQGADSVRGQGGGDRFVYRSIVDAGDTIIDFNRAEGDKVDLKGALASVGYGGSTPITDGYLKFVAKGGDTLLQIDPDGSGLAAARNFILFKNVSLASLSNPDNFIV
ncbi:cadherin-like domain-containing protein [Cyanobium sp. Candia 9D4]|uniref:ELWxxDGT repeat protein n=1 Tax=Cyanobium sp. Candia 9D4 TaxID=2823707 RepID=UPI0020CDD74D|nr:ELWxxDGT repeat protein [Cyanobium sp. Candia 9D4]MCP9934861.1 cadherin-like domain-containing protein [Cyanobium sp. Candia 9D4]